MNLLNEVTNSMSYKLALKEKLNKLEEKMQQMELENEALIAYFESEDDVQVLLDTTEHTSKPKGNEIVNITNKLPKNPTTLSISELANRIVRGCSIKPSILRTTKSDSFISSNIVALDVDNDANNIVSINEFLALSRQAGLHPFLIYESFSSTKECPRYRVLYRFNKTITDIEEIDKLYNYVWQQFPDVPLDHSVRYYSILFGGKSIALLSNSTNIIPDLSNVSFIKKKQAIKATHKQTITHEKHITKEEVRANLIALRSKYAGQAMSAQEINQHIKLTDLLNVSVNEVFRCVLPNHNDEHPSARVSIDKDNPDEQFYICTCEAMGYRTISLYKELFGLSSTTAAIKEISDLLEINTEYQKHAKDFIDTLYSNFDYVLGDELLSKLGPTTISMYLFFLRVAREKAIKPVSNNDNDITLYVSNQYIKNKMVQEGLSGAGNVNERIAYLCELGFIRKLTEQEKDQCVLSESRKTSTYNDYDYYCILDLTDERLEFISNQLSHNKKVGYRRYGTSAQRRINAYGYDYIRNNVNTQAYSKREDREVVMALTALIDSGAKYFNEDDINKAIRKRNHRINKKQATKLILDFLNGLVEPFNLERVRVNKSTRKQHDIDKKYKANSIVYIVNNDDIEYLEKMI